MGPSLANHTAREPGDSPAGFTVGLKHDEIDETGTPSCNRAGDHYWGYPENTDLLGLRDWVRRVWSGYFVAGDRIY